jgi:hypothetical protein
MTRSLSALMLGLSLSGGVCAAERLWFDDRQLELKAQTRACYLGFLELYDVDFFRNQTESTSCFARRFLQIWVEGEDEQGNPQWGFSSC